LLRIIVPHGKLLGKVKVSNCSIEIVSEERGKHEIVRKRKGSPPTNTYISMSEA
jgi:hypothetical protein